MHDDALQLGVLVLAGAGIGLVFFSGLWFTVQGIVRKKQAGLILALSFTLRMGLVGISFYLLMGHDWQRLVALAMGFTLARVVMIRRIRRSRAVMERAR